MSDHDVTIFSGINLREMPEGLTMRTAHAAMEAMAAGTGQFGDRSIGDVLIEAVRGLASHPEVIEALHREVCVLRASPADMLRPTRDP